MCLLVLERALAVLAEQTTSGGVEHLGNLFSSSD